MQNKTLPGRRKPLLARGEIRFVTQIRSFSNQECEMGRPGNTFFKVELTQLGPATGSPGLLPAESAVVRARIPTAHPVLPGYSAEGPIVASLGKVRPWAEVLLLPAQLPEACYLIHQNLCLPPSNGVSVFLDETRSCAKAIWLGGARSADIYRRPRMRASRWAPRGSGYSAWLSGLKVFGEGTQRC